MSVSYYYRLRSVPLGTAPIIVLCQAMPFLACTDPIPCHFLNMSAEFGNLLKRKRRSMANTYTQIHIQFVFAPKYRAALIHPDWEDELYKYITGIVQNIKSKMISINGTPDHLHLLVGFHTTQSISDFMQDVKAASSKWINDRRLTAGRFEWQAGYGAFSYSKSQLPSVAAYIDNQKAHHRRKTFLEEYRDVMQNFHIEYNERYIFHHPQ